MFLLQVRTYILLSSDQIYDVCERQPDRLTVESDAQRPQRDDRATELKHHFAHADSKFMVCMNQTHNICMYDMFKKLVLHTDLILFQQPHECMYVCTTRLNCVCGL